MTKIFFSWLEICPVEVYFRTPCPSDYFEYTACSVSRNNFIFIWIYVLYNWKKKSLCFLYICLVFVSGIECITRGSREARIVCFSEEYHLIFHSLFYNTLNVCDACRLSWAVFLINFLTQREWASVWLRKPSTSTMTSYTIRRGRLEDCEALFELAMQLRIHTGDAVFGGPTTSVESGYILYHFN